ncbi:MAG: hypothetical protein DRI88_13450 [Bacteroidetes bacterium]|nr:MAG: hypothetical protein DRI88_13450 [Bacteroidota bacterium]HHL57584.1 hypothetical protein [Bacteroidota bacterium]
MPSKSRKKKQDNNKGLIIIIITVIVIAAISIIAGWYFSDRNTKETVSEGTEPSVQQTDKLPSAIGSVLDGTWVSKYDGAILTVNGRSFSLELPSVDKQVLVAGTIRIHEQTAVLKNISANANCKGLEGQYTFSVKDKNLQFQLVKDECAGRKERMTAGWFRL